MNVKTFAGFETGQIVVTDRPNEAVTIELTGLAAGDEIKVIESGRHTRWSYSLGARFASAFSVEIDPTDGVFVRVEVYSQDGVAKVLTNPVCLIRSVPAGGLSPFKGGVDLGGVFSTRIRNLTITGAAFETGTLTLEGSAEAGETVLDCSHLGPPERVEFGGVMGNTHADGVTVTLSDLEGTGSVSVVFANSPERAPFPPGESKRFPSTSAGSTKAHSTDLPAL